MNQEKVKELLQETLNEDKSLFLIDLSFLPNNTIKIVVDGDSAVSLNDCIRISRNIEHNLDREKEDFALEVTSPNIAEPLKVKRQYKKNIHRILKVKNQHDTFEGTLTQVNENDIVLQWKTREPKPIGKGKVTVEKTITLPYTSIKEAKVKIIF